MKLTHSCTQQILTTLRALTSSLFGIGAGILGLESYSGFIFYLVFSLIVSGLFYVFRVLPGESSARRSKKTSDGGKTLEKGGMYFTGLTDLWLGGLVDGLSGFVLTWTLAYGLVRA